MPAETTTAIKVATTLSTAKKVDVKPIKPSGDSTGAELFFAAKTPKDLQASLRGRQAKLQDPKLSPADRLRFSTEVPIIDARVRELDRLSHLTDPKNIKGEIASRRKSLSRLENTPETNREKQRIQVEIEALTQASARVFFQQKKPDDLRSSLRFRENVLLSTTLIQEDRERFTREIPIIRELLGTNGQSTEASLSRLTIRAKVIYGRDVNQPASVNKTKARVDYESSRDRTKETVPVLISHFEPVKTISPTLQANPEAVLDEKKEIERYISLHSKAYMEDLQRLDAQIARPMSPNCRVAICIPAYHEEKNIYRTLLNYTKQTGIRLDQLEVVVLDNHRVGKTKDNTEREVRRFQKEHAELAVSYVYAVFPTEHSALGNIRKTSQDIALFRSMKRPSSTGDLIIASNDADSYGFRTHAFSWIINAFDKNTSVDLIVGKYGYPEAALKKFPVLRAIFDFDKTQRIINESKVRRNQKQSLPMIFSSGFSSYYRASVYASIGGYDSRIIRGSDINIGHRIINIRKEKNKHVIYSNAPKVYVDPRRALSKMISGQHWVNEWDDKIWQEDPKVAGRQWQEFTDQNFEVFTKEQFEIEVNAWLKRRLELLRKQRPNVSEADLTRWMKPTIERTFNLMGVKADIKSDKISILDTTDLESRLYGLTRAKELAPVRIVHVPKPSATSETLSTNPETNLDDKKETLHYLSTLPQGYRDELDKLNGQIPRPMSPECAMAICIPARGEEKSIYRTLLQYAKQKNLDPKSYEIYVFVAKDQGNPTANKTMLSEITRFQQCYPDMPVHYLAADFGTNDTYLGQNAKIMTDLALLRRSKIPWDKEQFVVVRNDADAWSIRDTGFRAMLDKFAIDPNLDVMFGKYDFPVESYRQFPVFHAFTLFHRAERRIRSRNFVVDEKRGPIPPHASGGSTYMRAGIYAAVGGYNKDVGPEDSEILDRIRTSRKFHAKHIFWSNAVNLKTDPRRPLGFMTTGHHFIDQWNRSIMALRDPRVAGKTWQEFTDPELEILSRKRLEEEINAFISSQKKSTKNESYYLAKAIPAFQRIIHASGIDAEVLPDGTMIVKNIEKLQSALRESTWGTVRDRTMLELQLNKLVGYRSIFKPDSKERQTLERDIAYFESRLAKK